MYNQTLAACRDAYEQGVSRSWYETKAMLPGWKEARSSLKLAHSQVLQNVTQRVDLAFQGFFRRVKGGAADLKRVQKLKDAAKNAQQWDENRRHKKALAHIHEPIANRRSDFAYKRSRQLVNTY